MPLRLHHYGSMLRLPLDAFMGSSTRPRLVENTFRLALTGTPGTGKTTIAALLSKEGFVVVTIEELAEIAGALDEVDPVDNAHPVDLDVLCDYLAETWEPAPSSPILIDGHLSHHLPADAVVVLRCDPETLRGRLENRGYSAAKTEGNLEWELLGGAWNEREARTPWIDFDTSEESAEAIVSEISKWISDGFKPADPEAEIDWIARMDD